MRRPCAPLPADSGAAALRRRTRNGDAAEAVRDEDKGPREICLCLCALAAEEGWETDCVRSEGNCRLTLDGTQAPWDEAADAVEDDAAVAGADW